MPIALSGSPPGAPMYWLQDGQNPFLRRSFSQSLSSTSAGLVAGGGAGVPLLGSTVHGLDPPPDILMPGPRPGPSSLAAASADSAISSCGVFLGGSGALSFCWPSTCVRLCLDISIGMMSAPQSGQIALVNARGGLKGDFIP